MKMTPAVTFVICIVVSAVAFFAGMKYQQTRVPQFMQFSGRGVQLGRGNMPGGNRNVRMNRPVSGEITKKDDTSVTVKMNDGSTKLVILSSVTKVHKNAETTKDELKTGTQISVIGTENSDGSVTAQDILLGFSFRK